MERHRVIALGLTCCMVLLVVWQIMQTWQEEKHRVSEMFGSAVKREEMLRQPDVVYSFPGSPDKRPDSLRVESEKGTFYFQRMDSLHITDRWKWTYQCYLLLEYPSRATFLDSLLQDQLKKEPIKIPTAVSLFQGDSLINCSNAELCQPRYELTAISFGAGNGKITLKSYASFPIGYLLSRTYNVWIILAIWIAATAILLYVYRKKKPIAVPSISFNSQSGLLKNGRREVHLKQNRLLIFRALWEASEHVCNYEELCQLLGRPLRMDKDENRSIKASLKQTIQLLKGDLKEFPELEIVNLRGIGYQLLVK